MSTTDIQKFIQGIPKCEIHMHLQGNVEPELVFKIAERNSIELPYKTPDDLKRAYVFKDLTEFIDVFRQGASVVKTGIDLYEIAYDYLTKAHANNVTHCELYYDPTSLIQKGIPKSEVIGSVIKALEDGEKEYGIKAKLIFSISRNRPVECFSQDFFNDIYDDHFCAVVFDFIHHRGCNITIHAGEDGPSDYIIQALDALHANRIDHGNACISDPLLMKRLSEEKIPLTMCPLSNLALNVIPKLEDHPIKTILDTGIIASINSDDPAFFRSYITTNLIETQKALHLSKQDIVTIVKNGYIGSFFSDEEKQKGLKAVDDYVKEFGDFDF